MKQDEITRIIDQLIDCCIKKPLYLTSSQIFDGIVHLASLYILSKHNKDIATSIFREVPPAIYTHNLKFRDEIVDYINSISHNFDDLINTYMKEIVIKNVIENISRSGYQYLVIDILKNEYQIPIASSNSYNKTLNINNFSRQISNCRIENLVDMSPFHGDRGKISYTINRFFDLDKINSLKESYADCQHPYVNWTFQFISSVNGDKIDYLKRVFKRFSNMDFSTESNDEYHMYGYAFSFLAVIDLCDKSIRKNGIIWLKLLKFAYLFLTQFVLVSQKKRNIMVSDAYSNRARLMHAYQEDFHYIFFSETCASIDIRFNYVSDKYLAFVVGKDPSRTEFHIDALMMYQNGTVKSVTGIGLTMGDDGTFQDVVNGGILRSEQLYSVLVDSFINGTLYLSDSEIDWILNRIKEKWLALKPIYPLLLYKDLGN